MPMDIYHLWRKPLLVVDDYEHGVFPRIVHGCTWKRSSCRNNSLDTHIEVTIGGEIIPRWYSGLVVGFNLTGAKQGWIIDPKLKAVSSEYELRQAKYLEELERGVRWEEANANGAAGGTVSGEEG